MLLLAPDLDDFDLISIRYENDMNLSLDGSSA